MLLKLIYYCFCFVCKDFIENEFLDLQEVNMKLAKFDELDALIKGMLFVEGNNPKECYYFAEPTDDDKCQKVLYNFSDPYPFLVSCSWHSLF